MKVMKVTAESSRGRELKRLYSKYSDLPNNIIREITEFRLNRKIHKNLYVRELVRLTNRMKILCEKIVYEPSYSNYTEYEMLKKSKERIIKSYLKDKHKE